MTTTTQSLTFTSLKSTLDPFQCHQHKADKHKRYTNSGHEHRNINGNKNRSRKNYYHQNGRNMSGALNRSSRTQESSS